MFRRFGSRVTLVQRADRLLPAEDPDVSAVVLEAFTAEDIEVHTATTCVSASAANGRIRIGCEGQGTTEIEGSQLLIAVGESRARLRANAAARRHREAALWTWRPPWNEQR